MHTCSVASVVCDCNSMDCSPPGSSAHGILQARIPEWVAIPFSRRSSWPRDWTRVSHIVGRFFTIWAARKAQTEAVLSRVSRIWLCDPKDCRLPGSSVHGILQVRILEWVAMSSSRGSSPPRDLGYFAIEQISLKSFPSWFKSWSLSPRLEEFLASIREHSYPWPSLF